MTGLSNTIFNKTRRRSRRQRRETLKTSTIREFDGGWNVLDNDLNLTTNFARLLDNMVRGKDGSLSLRYGTRVWFEQDTIASGGADGQKWFDPLGADPIATTNGSATVTITTPNPHGFIAGHTIALSGITADVNGIPLAEFNGAHTIVSVTSTTKFTITLSTNATSAGNGGGNAVRLETTDANHFPTGDFVDITVYDDRLIAVAVGGGVYEITANPAGWLADPSTVDTFYRSRLIFSETIANAQTGSPSGWSKTDFVSFAVFGGELLIFNGVDKPLIVNFENTFPCSYLVDLATGSNANTPIARYVLAMDEFVLAAGDPNAPGTVHISNQNTSGTWEGDPNPNNGTSVDLTKVITSKNFTIRGLARFRDQVAVLFDDNIVMGQIGVFDSSSNHTPDFSDVIELHGSIAHRSAVNLGEDTLMLDSIGVASIAQALFTNTARPDRKSTLIDREIRRMLQRLSIGKGEDHVFAIYNQRESQYWLFIPDMDDELEVPLVDRRLKGFTIEGVSTVAVGSGLINVVVPRHGYELNQKVDISGLSAFAGLTTGELNKEHTIAEIVNVDTFRVNTGGSATSVETGGGSAGILKGVIQEYRVFCLTYLPKQKIQAWSRFRGWNFIAAARDNAGDVFLATNNKIYVYGSEADEIFADYIGDSDMATDLAGNEIDFDWELPWADFDQRMKAKKSKYIAFDAAGDGQFTCQMYIDNRLVDAETGDRTPELEMSFFCNDMRGFGYGPITSGSVGDDNLSALNDALSGNSQNFGGGRQTRDERLWAWPAKFKISKLRFFGSTRHKVSFVSVSIAYEDASVRR